MLKRKYIIVCTGEDEGDLDLAFGEALRRINDGFTVGHDKNETGSFRFTVSERPDRENA